MPKSACTNGRATGIDHMPTLPMVPTATANPSRRHAAGESTSLSWRSRKSRELPGNEFATRTSHGPPVSSTLRGSWLQLTNRHVCERLHGVLTANRLIVFAAGACGRKFRDRYPCTNIFVDNVDNGEVLGPRCAIATRPSAIISQKGRKRSDQKQFSASIDSSRYGRGISQPSDSR